VVKTIEEFGDEVKTIRREIYERGENADVRLVASWLDRLLISLESLAPKLDLMMLELEQLNKASGGSKKTKIKKKAKKMAKAVKKKKKR